MNRKRHTKKINLKKYINEQNYKEEDARSYYNAVRWYFGIFEVMEEHKPFDDFVDHIVIVTDLIDDMQGQMHHDWYTNVTWKLISTYKELKYRLKNLKQLISEVPSDDKYKADSLETIKEFEEWLVKINQFTNWQFTDGKIVYESKGEKQMSRVQQTKTLMENFKKYINEAQNRWGIAKVVKRFPKKVEKYTNDDGHESAKVKMASVYQVTPPVRGSEYLYVEYSTDGEYYWQCYAWKCDKDGNVRKLSDGLREDELSLSVDQYMLPDEWVKEVLEYTLINPSGMTENKKNQNFRKHKNEGYNYDNEYNDGLDEYDATGMFIWIDHTLDSIEYVLPNIKEPQVKTKLIDAQAKLKELASLERTNRSWAFDASIVKKYYQYFKRLVSNWEFASFKTSATSDAIDEVLSHSMQLVADSLKFYYFKAISKRKRM